MSASGDYLLDTNIVVALFARDAAILAKLNAAASIAVPVVVLGELYYGARKSGRSVANLARVDTFAAGNVILDCDQTTAQRYGAIKNELLTRGRPIPENDIWIAAVALQHRLTLVSRDRHFQEIPALQLERW
jgi:tRNA(fMet)-specific endonuclease VapC